MISKETSDLLVAEKEMLQFEPIDQFCRTTAALYIETVGEECFDTKVGAAKRKYISLRIKEIDNILKINKEINEII